MNAAPTATDRLFFAVLPDAATARRIDALAHRLRGELGLTGRPLGPARYHATIAFLGDHAGVPPALLERLAGVAATVRQPAFELRFDRVASFARARHSPLVLRGEGAGVAGLLALAATLRTGLAPLGLAEARGVTPHLTLLRDDRVLPSRAVEPIAWRVQEFTLMCSRLGQGRHDLLARWPLAECGENPGSDQGADA